MSNKLFKLIFALSLLAGGWSHVVAAAWCTHQECMTSNVAEAQARAADVDANATAEHCAGMERSEHQSHAAAVGVEDTQDGADAFQIINQRTPERCTHCTGAPAAPSASMFVNAPEQVRRDAGVSAARVVKTCVLPEAASYTSRAPSQKSPPGSVQSKFLLTHSFLI